MPLIRDGKETSSLFYFWSSYPSLSSLLSHRSIFTAAGCIRITLNVLYLERNRTLLVLLFKSAGFLIQLLISLSLKKLRLNSSLPWFTFRLRGSEFLVALFCPSAAFSSQQEWSSWPLPCMILCTMAMPTWYGAVAPPWSRGIFIFNLSSG